MVLADGSVVEAAETGPNADLWWGLRGGTNNFGIVTSMTYRTFKQDLLWQTMTVHPITEADNLARTIARLMAGGTYDPDSFFLTGWTYLSQQNISVAMTQLVHTRPSGDSVPELYKPILALPTIQALQSPPVVASMSTLAERGVQFRAPLAARYLSAATTFVPTEAMIRNVHEAFVTSVERVRQVSGLRWIVSIEPFAPSLYDNSPDNGARQNALGLDAASRHHGGRHETLATLVVFPAWTEAGDDDTVYAAARGLVADVEARARGHGVYDPFLFMNYAAPWQDVIASYGEESVAKLRALRERVDPGEVFTKQVKGGFKIPSSD